LKLSNTSEWLVYDEKQENLVFVQAKNWKEATNKAMKKGFKPRSHLDVRPRTGDSPEYPCTPEDEFNEYMDY